MTRINLVPLLELSDQHLFSEYRELPRMAKHCLATVKKKKDIKEKYTLNAGHMTFFFRQRTIA